MGGFGEKPQGACEAHSKQTVLFRTASRRPVRLAGGIDSIAIAIAIAVDVALRCRAANQEVNHGPAQPAFGKGRIFPERFVRGGPVAIRFLTRTTSGVGGMNVLPIGRPPVVLPALERRK